VWGALRIEQADKAITPEIGTTATGTSNVPNPPSRAVTGGPKDILAIAAFTGAGELADNDSLVTTFPTNYTDGQIEKTGGVGGTNLGGLLGVAARQISAASSEDPGTFTQNASRAWRAQTIVVHGVIGTDHTVNIDDSVTVTDSASPYIEYLLTITEPPLGLADDLVTEEGTGGTAHEQNIDDSVTVSDDAIRFDWAMIIEETVILDDSITAEEGTGGTAHSQPIDDSVTVSDAIRFDRAIVIADTLGIADNIATLRAYFRTFDDSVSVSDNLAKVSAFFRAVNDTISLADSMRFDRGMTIAETVALLDALAFQREMLLTETLPLSDELTPSEGEGGVAWERSIDDSVSVADAFRFDLGMTIADGVSLADTLRFDRLLVLTETVSIADAIAKTQAITLTDAVSVADALSAVSAYNIFLADDLDITDEVTLASQINVEIADALLIRDAILRYKNDVLITDDVVAVIRRGAIVIGRF
jgi:hypothetical protein